MHQTFYIDVDEEVNSIISRLRKSTSQYNILVIAQQALILQSSVSLRLIKKEMDMLKKKIMIVTQDERGLAMAKKVGFPVKKTIDEIKKPQETTVPEAATLSQENNEIEMSAENDDNKMSLNERNRLSNLGDSGYVAVDELTIEDPIKKEEVRKEKTKEAGLSLGATKESEFGDLFAEKISSEPEVTKKNKVVIGGAKKFLVAFSIISIALLIGVFAYLFFPKAEINIIPKKTQKNINLTIEAQEDPQRENNLSDVVSLKSILVEEENILSLDFQSTGQKASANKKARGVITIYNDFSEASQILVATTRFLTEDEKLFRLTRNITVPGMKIENGEKISGEINAEIIADQPGEEYNIDPAAFKIPGFKGGPKYDKFSAKSEEKLKGGGEGEFNLKTISQTDIDNAEEETLKKIKAQLAQKIKESSEGDGIFLEDSIEYEVLDSASFPEIGAVADSFEYQIKVRAKYLTFSAAELDEEINKYMSKEVLQQDVPMKIISANKKYGKSKNDFSDNSVEAKLVIEILLEAEVDIEKIKEGLLGKNQVEVDEFIKQHPEIKKIDASISPNFLASRIPKYSSRVKISISNQE
jgi:hypothetical protein